MRIFGHEASVSSVMHRIRKFNRAARDWRTWKFQFLPRRPAGSASTATGFRRSRAPVKFARLWRNHIEKGYDLMAATGKSKGKRGSGKRELIDTGSDKRYVRRDGEGKFKESDDVGRSLAADRRKHAKTESKSGYGDRGDRKR